MTRRIGLLLIVSGVALVLFAACGGQPATSAPATEPVALPTEKPVATEAPTEAPVMLSGDPVRGGRLYDEWFAELGLEAPEGDHPLWTDASAGEDTWRCKECHGWDYSGVMGMSGKDPNEILGILKGSANPGHDFSAYMDDQALTDLALFVNSQLMDTATLINADGSLVGGDAAAGKTFFDDTCAECHGPQGLALNFHAGSNDEEPEYQGNIASGDPWEFLHKMRFGQTGFADMPSLVDDGVSVEDFANVLAYAATFPTSSHVSEGGVMYDNWMKAFSIEPPATDQPLFATQTTNTVTGADTWRCKECHGWDYKGADGRYGSGSHMTGFKGVLDSSAMSAEDLTAWLNGTKNPDHNFGGEGLLNEDQLQMLVAFLQSEKIDTSAFINDDKTIVGGNADNGTEFFSSNCAMCHGDDGTAINFGDAAEPEFVGTVAADNPWEFVHKVSYGHPGAIMPSGINMDWSLQDIIDLLTFAQSLP